VEAGSTFLCGPTCGTPCAVGGDRMERTWRLALDSMACTWRLALDSIACRAVPRRICASQGCMAAGTATAFHAASHVQAAPRLLVAQHVPRSTVMSHPGDTALKNTPMTVPSRSTGSIMTQTFKSTSGLPVCTSQRSSRQRSSPPTSSILVASPSCLLMVYHSTVAPPRPRDVCGPSHTRNTRVCGRRRTRAKAFSLTHPPTSSPNLACTPPC